MKVTLDDGTEIECKCLSEVRLKVPRKEPIIKCRIEDLPEAYRMWIRPRDGYWAADRDKLREALLSDIKIDGVELVDVPAEGETE